MIKTWLVLPVLAATAAVGLLAGCGSDGSSSTDPASVSPADAPVFIEAKIQPTGTLKTNLEAIASRVAGVDDLGGTIISYIEESASDSDKPLDYDKEIQPWLGESAGIFLTGFDGNDFNGNGIAVEVTETGEAQAFLDERVETESDQPPEDASYEGVDYKVDPSDETSIGIVGNFIVYGSDQDVFKEVVDASEGDALAAAASYKSIAPSAPESSLADVFVDIGGLIKASGSDVDPSALKFFEATGVELEEASALVSLVPGADNVEIDVSSDLAGGSAPSGNASELLGSLPAKSVAALAVTGFGGQVRKAIDGIDESGVPGQIPPNELKSTLKQAGIDLDEIAGSVENAAVFAIGRDKKSLEGALVLTTDSAGHASEAVASVKDLLKKSGTTGVIPINGAAKGFEVRSPELGERELVVASRDKRIAIGYGFVPAALALTPAKGAALSDSPAYNEALDALGNTPISGFVDGPAALHLAEGLLSADENANLEELKPYLRKIPYLAIGAETKGDVAQARLILGLTK
jgi:hypothetical protein